MKLKTLNFKSDIRYTFVTIDKDGVRLRLNSSLSTGNHWTLEWVALIPQIQDALYGWQDLSKFRLSQERAINIAPIDTTITINTVKIEDLQTKASLLHNMYAIEYSANRIYKPISIKYTETLLKEHAMRAALTRNLNSLSVADLNKLGKAVPHLFNP